MITKRYIGKLICMHLMCFFEREKKAERDRESMKNEIFTDRLAHARTHVGAFRRPI